jgi:ribosomal protein L7Ae-like RNA K-turn-binding protein
VSGEVKEIGGLVRFVVAPDGAVVPDISDRLPGRGMSEALLARRCLDLLGLARRAGQAALGFEKVRALIRAGGAILLIAARDGADHGKSKLHGLGKGLPVVGLFTNAELSLAFGRENVIHAALAPGRLADSFLSETVRLAEFRPAPG